MTGTIDRRPLRQLLTRAWDVLSSGVLALNVLGLTGFFVRDRNVLLALLLYLPLAPTGLAAVLVGVLRLGRSPRGAGVALAGLGFLAVGCSCVAMVGRGPGGSPTRAGLAGAEVRLLHWNVLWGGRPRTDAGWASVEDAIVRRRPDVVILSEAPPAPRLDSLKTRLGPGWSIAQAEHTPGSHHWYKLVVLSRWPVTRDGPVAVRRGVALAVRVGVPGRGLRLLAVDGQSTVSQLRTPFLHDLAGACRRAADAGDPFDLLAGDFNAVGRSLGFDALRVSGGGYEPASASSRGWRGTWPVPLPLLDIDHVWVRDGLRVRSCSIFADRSSDHRGQLVRLSLPGPAAGRRTGVARP